MTDTFPQVNEITTEMNRLSAEILKLGSDSQEVGEIVRMISQLASQTNLLALNASLKVAQPDKHGQSLADVAGEIRKLTGGSISTVGDITQRLGELQTATGRTNPVSGQQEGLDHGRHPEETTAIFLSVKDTVEDLMSKMENVSNGRAELQHHSNDVMRAITSVVEVMETAATIAQETNRSGKVKSHTEHVSSMAKVPSTGLSLSALADKLKRAVARLRL